MTRYAKCRGDHHGPPRWQRGQSPPGLPAHIYDLFPDRPVDSELGEIPAGWGVGTLAELIEIDPPRALRMGATAPYVDMASMPVRGHVPENVIGRPFGSGSRFINGDTLLARVRPCLENGKTAYVDFLGDGQVSWGSTELIVLRPKPLLPTAFASCLARSEDFRGYAIQSMTCASARQRVQPNALAHYQLAKPSGDVAPAFGSILGPLFAKSRKATAEPRSLAPLRDTLLPKLIRGEIRPKKAEGFLEEGGL